MNIVVIGNGMYVSGRGTNGYGTVIPAILEYKRSGGKVTKVYIIGTNKNNSIEAKDKALSLIKETGVEIKLETYPNKERLNKNIYKEVLSKIAQPACAIIAVPDHLHFTVTKETLNSGFHSLVVKPFTTKLEDGKELCKLARNKNLYGAVEFHKRWDRQNIILKDSFKNGIIGDPLYSIIEYSQRKSIPEYHFSEWVTKTNILQYLGVHYIDLIHFITGAKPKRTMAVGQKNWLKSQKIDTYDSIQCLIEWEMKKGSHFIQSIHVNWIDPETSSAASDQKLKFIGTKGRVELDQKDRGLSIIRDNNFAEHINPDFCRSFIGDGKNKFYQGYGIDSIKTFLKDINQIRIGKKSPIDFENKRPTFKSALISVSIIEKAQQSLDNNNSWISIK